MELLSIWITFKVMAVLSSQFPCMERSASVTKAILMLCLRVVLEKMFKWIFFKKSSEIAEDQHFNLSGHSIRDIRVAILKEIYLGIRTEHEEAGQEFRSLFCVNQDVNRNYGLFSCMGLRKTLFYLVPFISQCVILVNVLSRLLA